MAKPKAALGDKVTVTFDLIGKENGDKPDPQGAFDVLEGYGLEVVDSGGPYVVRGSAENTLAGMDAGEITMELANAIEAQVPRTRAQRMDTVLGEPPGFIRSIELGGSLKKK